MQKQNFYTGQVLTAQNMLDLQSEIQALQQQIRADVYGSVDQVISGCEIEATWETITVHPGVVMSASGERMEIKEIYTFNVSPEAYYEDTDGDGVYETVYAQYFVTIRYYAEETEPITGSPEQEGQYYITTDSCILELTLDDAEVLYNTVVETIEENTSIDIVSEARVLIAGVLYTYGNPPYDGDESVEPLIYIQQGLGQDHGNLDSQSADDDGDGTADPVEYMQEYTSFSTIAARNTLQLSELNDKLMPVGSVIWSVFGSGIALLPDGYLLCNGAQYPIDMYPELYHILYFKPYWYGTTVAQWYYRVPEPDHFFVPDLSGYFVRGAFGDMEECSNSIYTFESGHVGSPYSNQAGFIHLPEMLEHTHSLTLYQDPGSSGIMGGSGNSVGEIDTSGAHIDQSMTLDTHSTYSDQTATYADEEYVDGYEIDYAGSGTGENNPHSMALSPIIKY